jgi:hypothetical protein
VNQKQAHDLIDEMIVAAQKCMSNLTEALVGGEEPTDVERKVLEFLSPNLMGGSALNTLEALLRYAAKERLETGDVYNALYLVHTDEAIVMTYGLLFGKNLIDPVLSYAYIEGED